MNNSITKINFKQYINIYNLSLLLATGYKVEQLIVRNNNDAVAVLVNNEVKIKLDKDKEGLLPCVTLALFTKNKMAVTRDTEKTLKIVGFLAKQDKLDIKPKTKEKIVDFVVLQEQSGILRKIESGSYINSVERTFADIEQSGTDVTFGLYRLEGMNSMISCIETLPRELKTDLVLSFDFVKKLTKGQEKSYLSEKVLSH